MSEPRAESTRWLHPQGSGLTTSSGSHSAPPLLRVTGIYPGGYPTPEVLLSAFRRIAADSNVRTQQQEALRNTAISERKDRCLHGAVAPNEAVLSCCVQYQAAILSSGRVLSRAEEAPVAFAHVGSRPQEPWAAARGVILSQATDAALAADFVCCRAFIRQAVYIDAARHWGAVEAGRASLSSMPAMSETIERTHTSVVEARAFLARECGCGCIGPKYTSLCALPGCGAAHEVEGAVLRCCTRCRTAWYCGKEHQAAHWKAGHKRACGAEATAGGSSSGGAAK